MNSSAPRPLARHVRQGLVGKREFSHFVSQALAREPVDQNRAGYVTSSEKDHDPLVPQPTPKS
jgi:hypothetical protein